MKFLTVVGARPQFIKVAPLSREIEKRKGFEEVIVHTGQHFDKNMSHSFFSDLDIPSPKYNLGINGSSHGKMTASMISDLEDILIKESPDFTIVYGDTNSTLAGAIASSKLAIPIIHIEAGLRSDDIKMPEEVNRLVTDSISHHLLCPSNSSLQTLLRTKMPWQSTLEVGDLMYDSFFYAAERYSKENKPEDQGILVTLHRQENTKSKEELLKLLALIDKVAKHLETSAIFPVHPRIKKTINSVKENYDLIDFIEPQDYFSFQKILNQVSLVITDSGGLQKEAFWAKKPCITLRNSTEWIELKEIGVNLVSQFDLGTILNWIDNFDYELFQTETAENLRREYGYGEAAKKIINYFEKL